jgi:hypothetical protein
MMYRSLRVLSAVLPAGLFPGLAQAHIKWFHNYDLMQPPRDIDAVLGHTPFAGLMVLAALVLFVAAYADHLLLAGNSLARRASVRIELWAADKTYGFLRLLIGLLFAVLASDGRTLLTPELAASSPCVAEIQWVIAFTALFPATGAVAGTAILLLYGMAIEKYGLFHMFDYPAFVGAAVYLMWMSFNRQAHTHALALLRVATALTLMVGATEKFGYPGWSFDLLRNYPVLTFGVTDLEFYMVGAGLVEFALAYLLLFGRVSGKAGAAILFGLMASAILLFGWMDAVGHALFLAALLAMTVNRNPVAEGLQRGLHGLLHERLMQRLSSAAGGAARATTTALVHAAVSASLFTALVIGFVQTYHAANLALTLCSTAPDGRHIHK